MAKASENLARSFQELQQLQLPNLPIKNTNKNIFMTHLNIVNYLANTLKEQDLSSLVAGMYNYRRFITEIDDWANVVPDEKLIPTEQVVEKCKQVISRLSSTSTGI